MSESFEGGDIFVYSSFLHFQLLHLILGSLVFSVVRECVFEFAFHFLPRGMSEQEMRVSMDRIEPFVHSFCPTFDFGSFDEREEIAALLDGVACDGGIVIHEHKATELGEEAHCSVSAAIEAVWGQSVWLAS